jgi:ubiquinone/menaquinone biosynthesis C-methylase UbiE
MKLNLGCGAQVVDGWINVDYALGARLSKLLLFKFINRHAKFFKLDWDSRIFIHDLRRPFPWKNESIDAIYCSHTLEHFTSEEGLAFLNECHRVLKENSIIRIVVPDLQCIVNDYNNNVFPASDFIQRLDILYEKKSTRFKSFLATIIQFPHKCMYDTTSLLSILKDVGFDTISKDPFKSDIQDINIIELEYRTKLAVIVEGRKE